MATLSNYFGMLTEMGLVTFVMLGLGTFVTLLLRQPVEKIRAIQVTFFAVIAALILRETRILPSLPVKLFQPAETEAIDNSATTAPPIDGRALKAFVLQ